MSHRFVASTGAAAAVIVTVMLAPGPAAGQAPSAASTAVAAADPSAPLRTPWGDPDLQGVWSTATATPFERPPELAGRDVLTEAEAAALEKRAVETATDEARPADRGRDVSGAYNDFWWDRGTRVIPTRRTSLVIDPPDGRVPALTPEAQQRQAERAEARRARTTEADTWADRSLWERCITRGVPNVMLPGPYNNNYQILQTPGHVVILAEMIHDARIIPLDGRPHLAQNIRQWMGDSRGRWEGNTLVVDTANFTDKTSYRGSGANLHLVERFTRVNAETLNYEVTVGDPTAFTRSWTVALPATRSKEAIFEYACHEGNYGMVGILSGARQQEKATEDPGTQR